MPRHHHIHITRGMATALVVVMMAAGCGSTSDADQALETQRAQELVTATKAAGVAPRLTTETAEALYGTEAPAVCEAFDGGSSTSAEVILRGNLAQGRRKVITRDAIVYAGLVVRTYCPDVLADFRREIRAIQPLDDGS